MLPMFEPKRAAGAIIARRGKTDAVVAPEVEAPGSEVDPALKSAAESILSAIDHKSVLDLARALKDAHEACESYPHEEGPHTNESDEGEGE